MPRFGLFHNDNIPTIAASHRADSFAECFLMLMVLQSKSKVETCKLGWRDLVHATLTARMDKHVCFRGQPPGLFDWQSHQPSIHCTVLYCVFEVGSLEVSQADKVLDGIKHIPETARGMLSSIQGQTKTPNRGYAIKLESVP